MTTTHPIQGSGTRRQGAAGRRVGYAFAILINAVLLWLINVWPGWREVPFLTEETTALLPVVNASIAIGIAANLVYIAADPPRLRALGDVVVTTVGIVALVALWRTFPFAFTAQTFDWELVFRVLLVLGMAGSAIAIVVGLAKLVTGDSPHEKPGRTGSAP